MKQHKKTFLGGFVAILLGTSCCWMSTAAAWMGSVGIIGLSGGWFDGVLFLLLFLGVIATVFVLFKIRKRIKET